MAFSSKSDSKSGGPSELVPRILISADRSSSGKTTVSMGIMAVLKDAGYTVQPFKVALDYIDPEYHTAITGRRSRNLDGYLMNPDEIIDVFSHACTSFEKDGKGADIAIIEGVRGLFEGLDAFSDIGSTAQISKILKCPVILVINAKSMTRSCAALVSGFSTFDPDVNLAGVILNNIGSKRHAEKAVAAIESATKIPVIGVVYRDPNMGFSMRELGLIPIPEGRKCHFGFMDKMSKIKENIAKDVNMDRLVEIAKTAGSISSKSVLFENGNENGNENKDENKSEKQVAGNTFAYRPRIGIACDEAFNFYYPDNIDLLISAGARIVPFSPLADAQIPEVDALYIGGGTPEIFAARLSDNKSMRASIKSASDSGMPIFGESAGMNYLSRSITIKSNTGCDNHFEMVGAFKARTVYGSGKRIVTYTNGVFEKDTPIGKSGENFLAHEFHHSVLEDLPKNTDFAISITRGVGISGKKDGIMVNNTIGTYVHYHGVSYKQFAKNFVQSARLYHESKNSNL
ncbi:Ni-sirohydrochlorin a,c-diamide synthase [Methanolapillus ohkumae]|uniref:Cobyrinate a,c-diamide synthase n=1 Tax=Methanolapillus ohkumae TaxID=3028298 RepID=A0AA96V4S3_9EURY|nr:Cobyrinate a,c-diamide synthase [Methanosarcinaceae archaeon Am2]